MNFRVPVSLVLVAAVAAGASGCKKKSPVSPNVVTTAPTTIPATPPLPISTVAPYLGQTINSVFEKALTQGLDAKGANRWTYNCPAGGSGRVDLPERYEVQTGQVVMLEDTDFVLTDCTIETNVTTLDSFLDRLVKLFVSPVEAQSRARIVAKGRLKTRGKWRPPRVGPRGPYYRDGDVRMTGTLQVDQTNCGGQACPTQIGAIQLECNVNGTVCEGQIGGIGVHEGPKDTPPPPNPTTTTTTTTTTVPGPTTTVPGAVNVTGRWLVTNSGPYGTGSGVAVLTQIGTTITGSAVLTDTGATILINTFTGSVAGNTVTLRQVLSMRVTAEGASVTSTITENYTLQATNTSMQGTYTATVVYQSPVPIPTINDAGSSSWAKQ